MSFSIRFPSIEDYPPTHKEYYAKYRDLCLGRITIGDFNEHFESALSFWSRADYEAHWISGLIRILDGAETSCLITSITNPSHANFLFGWPLYRQGDQIIVQNHLFFLKNAKGHFDPKQPYGFISSYESIDESGRKISEWYTTIQEITEFLKSTPK